MKPEFERIAIGNTIKTIGLPYFKKLRIPLPPVQEQHTIAEVLVATDKRVFAEQASVSELRALKGALMSVLLTGELRVAPDGDAA
jgi:type I restriction enzyme S subunit